MRSRDARFIRWRRCARILQQNHRKSIHGDSDVEFAWKRSCESASVREGPEFGVTLDGWWAEVTPREDMGGMLMKVTVGVMAGRGRERWGRGKGRGVIAR